MFLHLRSRRLQLAASLSLILIVLAAFTAWRFLRARPAVPLSTPGGPLAFMSNRAGNWNIFCLDQSGTLTNLTHNEVHDFFPSFSFDGGAMLYVSSSEGSDLASLMDLGSGLIVPFGPEDIVTIALETYAKGRIDWGARWLRGEDGQLTRIGTSLRNIIAQLEIYAYENGQDEAGEITIHPIQLSDGAPQRDWMPDISPDGRWIAFMSNRTGDEDIYLLPYEGGEIMALAPHPAEEFAPFWSLDGQWVAFFSERDTELRTGTLRIYIVQPDGSDLHELAPGESFAGGAALAPDGASLVYTSNESGHWHLYQQQTGTETSERLTDGESDHLMPTWLPQRVDCQPVVE